MRLRRTLRHKPRFESRSASETRDEIEDHHHPCAETMEVGASRRRHARRDLSPRTPLAVNSAAHHSLPSLLSLRRNAALSMPHRRSAGALARGRRRSIDLPRPFRASKGRSPAARGARSGRLAMGFLRLAPAAEHIGLAEGFETAWAASLLHDEFPGMGDAWRRSLCDRQPSTGRKTRHDFCRLRRAGSSRPLSHSSSTARNSRCGSRPRQ